VLIKFLLILAIVFFPKHGIFDFSTLISLGVILFYYKSKITIVKREFLYLFLIIVYFGIVSLIVTIDIISIDKFYLPYYFAKFIRLFISFYALFLLLKKINIIKYEKLLNSIFIVNVSIVFFELFVPLYKDSIYKFTNFGAGTNYPHFDYRVAGLSMGFDAAGMVVAIGGVYFFVKMFQGPFKYKIFFLLSIIATMVTARVAFVGLMLTVFFYYCYRIILNIKYLKLLLIYLIPLVLVLFYFIYTNEFLYALYELGVNRNFDVQGYAKDGSFLFNSFKISENPFYAIFGYGVDSFTPYGARSDVGWFQLYWAGGIIGSVLIIGLYLYMVFRVIKSYGDRYYKHIFLFIVLLIFIGNFKGGYIFARQQTEILFIFYLMIINQHYLRIKHENSISN